ncbi:MAG: hypothetical protein JWQ88_878 [Rhodoferax sp.]|nr:hypothetical protein [Rhodoferax sp.]
MTLASLFHTANAAPTAHPGSAATSDADDAPDPIDTPGLPALPRALNLQSTGNAERGSGASGLAAATASPAKPATTATTPPLADIGRTVRDVARPILEEVAHSEVVEAVRSLDTRGDGHGGNGLASAEQDAANRDPSARRRNWDGTGQTQAAENQSPAAAAQDPGQSKARAAQLMSSLIDEVTPWVFGAAVLYVLAYMAKFWLAVRRRNMQRRIERRRRKTHRTMRPGSRRSPPEG